MDPCLSPVAGSLLGRGPYNARSPLPSRRANDFSELTELRWSHVTSTTFVFKNTLKICWNNNAYYFIIFNIFADRVYLFSYWWPSRWSTSRDAFPWTSCGMSVQISHIMLQDAHPCHILDTTRVTYKLHEQDDYPCRITSWFSLKPTPPLSFKKQ